ncbi:MULTISPECIES: phosphomevalonate kinase [unclassified Streptococcus]|uniref:phosphomevalonate kinase n=1 Tax=unclassified Streptococcus TaxID=2608887 RepID=UPI001071DF91|nr:MULTISPECIES: phosphomevalonate kinase [unclassified Streptococcus]MBF0788266.1 phosphomevalonate kinase [Streptococcus sp. 19428wC2_LYSM12]MCQ9211792.1 phosphomevalonate kinase [Streptococcus sp. B01]MCQ9212912.1 phosphomevalonate kinase [Streptococcus sp. O1]TFV04661.1 phosphomevalonate kinase [Streptococcus sp. LYSM12]
MLEASAPGKLYLAGEYAVVEAGYPALIAAVDQCLFAKLRRAEIGSIYSTQQPELEVAWSRRGNQICADFPKPYQLILSSMQVVEDYVRALGVEVDTLYRLEIRSDLDDEQSGTKYGLGSSGAVTVAVVKVLLSYYQQELAPILVYKLAVLAQLRIAMTGSFGDLAASSFGGMVAYHSVDRNWLKAAMTSLPILELVAQDWKELSIQALDLPKGLDLLVGWTGSAASTDQLVASMQDQLNQEAKEAIHRQFLRTNRACLEKLIRACQENDKIAVREAIATNRQQLQDFSAGMGMMIETPQLYSLCQLAIDEGAVAKSSGAGGGDCGICLVDSPAQKERIAKAWEEAGITPLPLSIVDAYRK